MSEQREEESRVRFAVSKLVTLIGIYTLTHELSVSNVMHAHNVLTLTTF